jgi:cell wall-associated NlpC family hydrolase
MQHSAARPVEPPFEIGDLFFFGEGDENRHVTHVGISLGGWTMIHSSRRQNGVYIDNIQEVESLREIYISAGSFLMDKIVRSHTIRYGKTKIHTNRSRT